MTWVNTYTPAMDAKIIEAIERGATSWAEVGEAVGKSGGLVRQRVERGLKRDDLLDMMRLRRGTTSIHEEEPQRVGADALPAGHPLTWGRMVAGTILEEGGCSGL